MNLQQLEYLKKIAETENFTTAAAILNVTQPALSKAISNLEAELNVPLFNRNGRTVELTTFGNAFLKHATLALMQIEKGINELNYMKNQEKGIISMASTYCIGSYFMPFIISGFLSLKPDIKFQFNHETTLEILRDLKDGKIALGFYDSIDDIHLHTEIESMLVKKEEYVLIVPKNHRLSNEISVSLKDLKDESFIVFSEEDKDKLLSYYEFIDFTPKVSLQFNQVSMLSGLVAAGVGITIVPNTPVINTNTLSVIKIKEDIGYKTIYMGWFKDSNLSPIAREFRDYVVSVASIN